MIKFIKAFISDDNKVNEDTVMGFLCFVVSVVTLCVPAIPLAGTYLFGGFMLTFFGKKMGENMMKINVAKKV